MSIQIIWMMTSCHLQDLWLLLRVYGKKQVVFLKKMGDTAEDTVFNINLIKAGAKFVVAKDAFVDWQMPRKISDFGFKIYRYAKGDAISAIWWHPVKKWQTHNLKILTIFVRYILFAIFLG